MYHESINPNGYMKVTDQTEQPQKPEISAFPLTAIVPPHGLNPNPSFMLNPGMTLRDYFAAKAMQTLVSDDSSSIRDDVTMAYRIADAMLEIREKELIF